MTLRIGLWARLTNTQRSIHVASGDWERVLMEHGTLTPTTDDRWSDAESSWLWTADEAAALANALVAEGGGQCRGSLMIDLDMGTGIQGTGHETVADGLTPEQRTSRLIQFLREGSFRWRFITGPNQVILGGSSDSSM